MSDKFTSYCGLYCLDCIPSNTKFFSLIQELDNGLKRLQFDEYAKLKSHAHPKLSDYQTFLNVLGEIKSLRCALPCRLGGGNPECNIRRCCQGKKVHGCWECDERIACKLLDRLKEVHPNLLYHRDLIREYGPDNWHQKRKVHYKWQQKL